MVTATAHLAHLTVTLSGDMDDLGLFVVRFLTSQTVRTVEVAYLKPSIMGLFVFLS